MASNRYALSLALFVIFTTASARSRPYQFQNFFPEYRSYFQDIRDTTCANLYEQLATSDDYCPQLMSCLLNNASEAIKANMASASVLLGIMPTLLSVLSSSPSETALLGRRRPLLALLLTVGSPAVDAMRLFSRPDPIEDLLEHTLPAEDRAHDFTKKKSNSGFSDQPHKTLERRILDAWLHPTYPKLQRFAIVSVEYLIALAAIANVIVAAVFAGRWTIDTTSCSAGYLPVLWVFLTPVAHVASQIALALRTKTVEDESPEARMSLRERLLKAFSNELKPCSAQTRLRLELDNDSILFILVSWFISVWTVAYVLYGTIAYSTLMFISEFCSPLFPYLFTS